MAAAALLVGVAAPAAQAAPSSGILPGSRITFPGSDIKATAAHGDTLYFGGSIFGVGLRSAGVAATDAGSGVLDQAVPELQSASLTASPEAGRVVADGRGGAYVIGAVSGDSSNPQVGTSIGGDRVGSNWLRLTSGSADLDVTKRFRTDDGSVGWVYDIAVASDGTTYVSGDFTKVDGQARAGLAAIKADGTLTAWAPQLTGGVVGDLVVAGDGVLLVGGIGYGVGRDNAPIDPFTQVGGQARPGLALVNGTTGAVSAWAPTTSGGDPVTQAAASTGIAVDGDTAYLATGDRILAVPLGEGPVARDLDVRPSGSISSIAAGAAGRLYVAGDFSGIGSQEAQPSRSGLAEIVGATGAATAWAPDAPSSSAIAVTDDAVYVGGALYGGGATSCAVAFGRTTAAKTAWDPRLGGQDCEGAASLAASGTRVWAAGTFNAANVQERRGFAAIDTGEDKILPWAPRVNRNASPSVQDMDVTADGQTVYIAANMDTINDVARIDAAAVAATGAANTAGAVRVGFDPAPAKSGYDPDGLIQELVLSADGQKVYAAGDFTSIGGQPRQYLASLSAATGQADTWDPAPDAAVNALELSPGGTLFAAGEFAHAGPAQVARFRLAAFTPGTSEPTAWDPQMAPGADVDGASAVRDLALGDGVVYAAGGFIGKVGGQDRKGVVALDAASGQATAWDARLSSQGSVNVGTVSTTADGTVYLIGYNGGEFDSVQGKRRANLASVTAGGTVTGWHPGNWENGYRQPDYQESTEVRELGDRVYVPTGTTEGFDGLPQSGFVSFGLATAPAALDPAVPARTTGSGKIDETLTCEPGSYSGSAPFERSYEWLVDGKLAENETGLTYTVREADAGGLIACRETVENAAGPLVSTSEPVRAQAVLALIGTAPEVSGVAKVGQALRCSEGLWTTRVDSYAYAWVRDGQPIGGATGSSYTLAAADLGRQVGCRVVAVNGAGASEPASSGTVTVAAADVVTPPKQDPPPVGNPPVGQPPVGNPPIVQPPVIPLPPGKPPVTQPSASVSVAGKASAGKGRRFTLSVSPSAAGRVSVVARLKVGRKLVTVATGSGSAKRSGALKLTLKPTSAGKRALRAGRSVTLSVRVTLKASNGATASATKSLKVKVKR